jgi:Uma2 family endonuclease
MKGRERKAFSIRRNQHMVADRSQVSGGLYMTVEQYLVLDESSDAKYEYDNGYVFMLRSPSSAYDDQAIFDMAGGSIAHAALCARVATILNVALAESSCMAYSSDARLKLAERQYYYPDVTVACGEQTGTSLSNPVLVIEVLSPSTEKRDRGAKFRAYKAQSSVQEYMLIGSTYKAIEVYRRDGNFWRQYHYQDGDIVELTSIGVSFAFDDVYRRINLQ